LPPQNGRRADSGFSSKRQQATAPIDKENDTRPTLFHRFGCSRVLNNFHHGRYYGAFCGFFYDADYHLHHHRPNPEFYGTNSFLYGYRHQLKNIPRLR
jgi:hypothetical protein